MDLDAYFARIGYSGPTRPDLATLTAVHRAHLLAIPYENLDAQMGRTCRVDPALAADKLVGRGRGGWCYEMNGTLGLVLQAMGFQVTRMAGTVMREAGSGRPEGNHLVLRVDLEDGPYIADVGFGDGVLEPIPLKAGAYEVAGYPFRLEILPDGWWRFHNHAFGGAAYFDFPDQPADPAQLDATCHWLSTSPDSFFTQTTMAFRHTPTGINGLLGRVLRRVTPQGKTETVLPSAEAYVQTLRTTFGVDVPEAAALWPQICAKHEAFVAATA